MSTRKTIKIPPGGLFFNYLKDEAHIKFMSILLG